MSRVPRLLRLMHTEGRRVPHPGQGGAAPQTTISPTPRSSHLAESGSSGSSLAPSQPPPEPVEHASSSSSEGDDVPHSSSSVIQNFKQPKVLVSPLDPSLRFTAKGKLIPHRPARTVPVQLPNGFPEPDTYPPSAAYLESIAGKAPPKRHPLWQFFRVPESAMQPLTAESTTPPINAGSLEPRAADDANLRSGRSWSADELRQKSFADLHTLWYVLLKERNLLATQGFEYARLGINPRVSWELIQKRSFRCRKAMARIKYVLNERRLGLIAATNPLIERPKPKLPWSALPTNDPAAGVEALRGEVPAPTHILRTQSARATPVDPEQVEEGGLEGEADRTGPVVPTQEVAKQEVEARDEGFGGGKEAKEFVQEVEVKDGHVQKKE